MRSQTRPLDGDLGRHTTIADIEKAIASRWYRKDRELRINAPKRSIGRYAGFECYVIDSEWVRDNLDVTFGTGGHGLVHTFIPLNEIWLDPIRESEWSLIFHEAVEFFFMLHQNMNYWEAHNKALDLQRSKVVSKENVERLIAEATKSSLFQSIGLMNLKLAGVR